MRRTALYLGGLLLATGASLAMAGPASAAPSGGCCGNDDVVYVQSNDDDCCYGNSLAYDYDDCDDDGVVYVAGNRHRNRILSYGGGTRVINTGQLAYDNDGILSGNNIHVGVLDGLLSYPKTDYGTDYGTVDEVETDY